jgi:hypothetical protein
MTRGGYGDSSTERKVKRNTRGVDSLSKRPGPALPPSVLESFLVEDGGTTIADNTLTTVTFEAISISAGSTAFTDNSGTSWTEPVKLSADGWYLFYVDYEWSGGGFADVRYYDLHIANFLFDNDGNQDLGMHASAPFEASFRGCWGPLYCRGTALSSIKLSFKVWHQAGSTQTVTGIILTGLFLGADPDPARFPPF